MERVNLDSPELYLNKELSWLEFNKRVLFEATEKDKPILERVKFIAIVSSNLEEFFMIRVAGLKKLLEAGLSGHSEDLMQPLEQLKAIRNKVTDLLNKQYEELYKQIIPALRKSGIEIITGTIKKEYFQKLRYIFENDILPIITPISVSPTHPFPNLISGRLYLVVELENYERTPINFEAGNLSFIGIPTNILGRFIQIDENVYIPLENIIRTFAESIYKDYRISSKSIVKVTRDADFEIEEDAVADLLTEIESTIKKMHIRKVVKLEYEEGISKKILNAIMRENELTNDDIYQIKGLLNLNDLMELLQKVEQSDLKEKTLTPVLIKNLKEDDIFEIIKEKDLILYHPYHSYEPIVELINRASADNDVLAIKQLLYRTSPNSKIINALIKAAENGKQVTAVVELKARFDEKRNIEWAKRLEDAGAYVIYGISGLKIHGKALLIVRREKQGICRYIHLATGNYNEVTARLYTDLSFFTCDESFGEDVSSLFNFLTGLSIPTNWNNIVIAPLDLRKRFITLIEREIENAKNGISSKIIAKMNSLTDKEIVKLLYKASIAGVKINLMVRGMCIARPINKNIIIRSIVGRYLEHARIYYFYNAGEEEYYLSSADWMPRNLDNRIEILFPIHKQDGKDFLRKLLDLQFEDTVNQWNLESDGSYTLVKGKHRKDSFKTIYDFIKKREEHSIEESVSKLISKIKRKEVIK